jgi:hypothetical protein
LRKANSGPNDLIPGAAAALGFLGITAVLGFPYLWLSAVMGAAIYFSVRWLMPIPNSVVSDPPTVPAEQHLAEMRALTFQVSDPDIRLRITSVCDQGASLLQYFTDHPMKSDESAFLVRQYLELSHSAVQMYIATVRSAASATQSREKLEELLDSVQNRFQKLYKRLTSEDDVALAGEIQVLTKTLDDLDKVCNTIRGETG